MGHPSRAGAFARQLLRSLQPPGPSCRLQPSVLAFHEPANVEQRVLSLVVLQEAHDFMQQSSRGILAGSRGWQLHPPFLLRWLSSTFDASSLGRTASTVPTSASLCCRLSLVRRQSTRELPTAYWRRPARLLVIGFSLGGVSQQGCLQDVGGP